MNSDKEYFGFSVSGHAGYKKKGEDIVCSAVSALVINTVNAMEALTENQGVCEQGEDGFIKFKFVSGSDSSGQLLMRALDMGLTNISKEYEKKYLQVHYKEV